MNPMQEENPRMQGGSTVLSSSPFSQGHGAPAPAPTSAVGGRRNRRRGGSRGRKSRRQGGSRGRKSRQGGSRNRRSRRN